mmetsp:Transcript_26558/g.74613  ORF Transcript_26558/g.74613 Transcript_26558/m.74613 type:complete len:582 (+) Transcript_26558:111-1856(+)|eukprot:CAMPEP_0117665170 /NCGR_PEP_ID=MMETSP0804-20121206/9657_1 /TAXON_ID=1074897 /ORGANISM="Tetraselmis astigmatica, Strain CCMP880" /LENGTH=581 /DNA_ID=CAMNT_0005472545 /DNA_START=320 /DNA_END=2065 /DNA_ORIENTATION=-
MDLGEAPDWELLGEGGANLVFGYRGSSPLLVGKVLRIKKKVRVKQDHAVRTIDDAVWQIYPGMVGSDTLQREAVFFEKVMAPMLGRKYVGTMTVIRAPSELIKEVIKQNAEKMRRVDKVLAQLELNSTQEVEAVLMRDMTFLSIPSELGAISTPCICVELKPKCGFVLQCSSVHPSHFVKSKCTRFHLQQGVKLAAGHVTRVSKYRPLQLFSQDAHAVTKTLGNLVEEPQNNFRVFCNGRMAYSSSKCSEFGMSSLGRGLHQALGGSLAPGLSESESAKLLVRLIAGIVTKEVDLLSNLLKVQKLETIDIEGVHEIYQQVLQAKAEAPPGATERQDATDEVRALEASDATEAKHCQAFERFASNEELFGKKDPGLLSRFLRTSASRKLNKDPLAGRHTCGCDPGMGGVSEPHWHTPNGQCSLGIPSTEDALAEQQAVLAALRNLPEPKKIRMLRDYVIAKTAQDCSIMFTFGRLEDGSSGGPDGGEATRAPPLPADEENAFLDPSTGARFHYKVGFVDLDVKSVAKIPRHYQVDLERIHAWHRMSNLVGSEESPSQGIAEWVKETKPEAQQPISPHSDVSQ